MVRSLLCVVSAVALCLGTGCDKDKKGVGTPATISKFDAKGHSVTLKAQGKDMDKEYKLTEEIRYIDSAGNVATSDIFSNGDSIFIIEEDGKLKEMKHASKKKDGTPDAKSTKTHSDKAPETKSTKM